MRIITYRVALELEIVADDPDDAIERAISELDAMGGLEPYLFTADAIHAGPES